MVEATFHFPKPFLWGSATAAYQVEGNNENNNWWAWENEPGRILQGHKAGLACDWWGGRWREDFDRAIDSGQNTHRMSVEWSRIQPAPDRWDEEALDHYRQMVRYLRSRNIIPMVTLHHFTDPLWLYERGAWENDISIFFAEFVEKVVDALKEYVNLWCTINEPNLYSTMGYILNMSPPGKKDFGLGMQVAANLLLGHAAAYHTIHRLQPNAQVGMTINYRDMKPARTSSAMDRRIARFISRIINDMFPEAASTGKMRQFFGTKNLPKVKGTQDFIGIDYYTRDLMQFDLTKPGELFGRRFFAPDAEISHTGFLANEPEGFYSALEWANQFNLPIYITENGIEDPSDTLRPRFLAQHIHQMWRAVNFNWRIKGYYHWTLVDNFEWDRGWTQRFGLWELDVDTQARRKRPSADMYAAICKTGSLSSDIVAKYAPGAFEKIFPA